MDTNLTLLNPEVVAEREAALRRMHAPARSLESAATPGDRDRVTAGAPRRRGVLDVVTPALFATLVAGLLALVAMGATVR